MTDSLFSQSPLIRQPDFIGRIDQDMLRMIVNIQLPNGSTGTGFIVNQGENIYLVTNKHMVGSYSLVDPFILADSITVFFYPATPDSSIQYVIHLKDKTGNQVKELKLHPDNDIDIAVILINDVYKNNSSIARNYLGTGFLKRLNEIGTETNLGFGSQIFTIGYPAGFKFATSNYPVAKAAFIASSLTGNLEITTNWKNRLGIQVPKKLSAKFFVVDGLIIGGNSGGPIISPRDFYYKVNNNQLQSLMYKSENNIIGIVSFGWEGTGLTVIYPCDYILDLIQ